MEEDLEKLLYRQLKWDLYYELNRVHIIERVKKYNAHHKLERIKYAKDWYEKKMKASIVRKI